MALAASWIKDSPLGLALMFHLRLTGLSAGLNTVNPQTLITDNSIYSYSSHDSELRVCGVDLSTARIQWHRRSWSINRR